MTITQPRIAILVRRHRSYDAVIVPSIRVTLVRDAGQRLFLDNLSEISRKAID